MDKYGAPKSNRQGAASPDILKDGKKPSLDICRGC
jgi:hypothetical protein